MQRDTLICKDLSMRQVMKLVTELGDNPRIIMESVGAQADYYNFEVSRIKPVQMMKLIAMLKN